jgi:hypothetical protein
MELAALLEDAQVAPPDRRIELRDRIAAHGAAAIEGVLPWLESDRLAAFAVRVIECVGVNGEPAVATKVLRSARTRVPANVTGDVDWALQRLKAVLRPAPPPRAAAPPAPSPRREPPRYDASARRRAR